MGKNRTGLFGKISLEIFLITFLFIAALFLFSFIVHAAVYENERVFDDKVFAFLAGYSTASVIKAMEVFTFFGSTAFLLPAYIILITGLLVYKRYRYSVDIAIIALSSTGIMFCLKQLFHRQRPNLPLIKSITNYSFPSGHALSSFIFCSILIYLVWQTGLTAVLKWFFSFLLLLFSITIGISRIVLKVHYATDVIASFCLGIAWAILSFWLLEKINARLILRRANKIQ